MCLWLDNEATSYISIAYSIYRGKASTDLNAFQQWYYRVITFAEDDYEDLQSWAGDRLVIIENDSDEKSLEEAVLQIVSERIIPLLQGNRS